MYNGAGARGGGGEVCSPIITLNDILPSKFNSNENIRYTVVSVSVKETNK